ncbi:unnamed protein product [Rotaria sordida]|uniref:Tudor domain-containing protein n=1 Tax=Rotaria sordida TaxID=392033 RepID=A0A813WGE1_9BILA|nr:unnamed protein product [Rotaria sordida]
MPNVFVLDTVNSNTAPLFLSNNIPDGDWNTFNPTNSFENPEKRFVNVNAILTDSNDNPWVVDSGLLGSRTFVNGSKFVKINLNTNIVDQIYYTSSLNPPLGFALNDVRIGSRHAYLTESGLGDNILNNEINVFEEHCDALLHLAQGETTIYSLLQQKLPDIKCQYLTINIPTVVDVNHFWAQYIDRETNAQMKQINEILSRQLIPLTLTPIEIRMMCAAPFILQTTSNQFVKPSQYYRARITRRIDNVTVEVFFVNWGNTEQIPIDQLRILDASLLKIAPLVYKCQLRSIRPNIARYPLNNWPIQAVNYVCSLILEHQVEAEIKSVARYIVNCDILLDIQLNNRNQQKPNEIGRTTLRQSLINKGFADTSNEEYIFEVKIKFINLI